jgi:hypothetical protein
MFASLLSRHTASRFSIWCESAADIRVDEILNAAPCPARGSFDWTWLFVIAMEEIRPTVDLTSLNCGPVVATDFVDADDEFLVGYLEAVGHVLRSQVVFKLCEFQVAVVHMHWREKEPTAADPRCFHPLVM